MVAPHTACGGSIVLLLLLPVLSFGASTKPIPAQMKYIAIGYDIIKGNPEGNQKSGGVDPGLLTTRRILKLTYEEGKTTNDNEYRVPDEVEFTRRSSSYTSKETDTFYGTKSYQKKLGHQVAVEAGVEAVFASFSFAASHKYQAIKNDEQTTGYVYFSEQTIENYGSIRYLENLAGPDGFEVDREFRVAVCGLPATYDNAPYMEFLSNWGTHIVKEADLGVRMGTTSREDQSSFIRDASTAMSNGASVGGSFKVFSASLSVDMDRFSKSAASQKKFGKEYTQYTVGSKENNEPISIKLIGINEALDPVFWSKLQEYESNGECPTNWPRATIQENILTAFTNYPSYNKVTQSQDKEELSITVTWPDGKYALPEAATLTSTDTCPTAQGMTWSMGMLYQNTDKDGVNTCSKGNHLTNYCERDKMRTYYCVKTTPKATQTSWTWMPGVYCIFKYGDTCPDGLTSGNIRWKDESSMKDPDYNTMPTGTYGNGGITEIEFCCREDGSTSIPIILPTTSPFYLIKFHDGCQQVLGMNETEEYIEWGTKLAAPEISQSGMHPSPGNTGRNVKIYYCFYQPIKSAKRFLGALEGGKKEEGESEVKKEVEEVRELLHLLEKQIDPQKRIADASQESMEEERDFEEGIVKVNPENVEEEKEEERKVDPLQEQREEEEGENTGDKRLEQLLYLLAKYIDPRKRIAYASRENEEEELGFEEEVRARDPELRTLHEKQIDPRKRIADASKENEKREREFEEEEEESKEDVQAREVELLELLVKQIDPRKRIVNEGPKKVEEDEGEEERQIEPRQEAKMDEESEDEENTKVRRMEQLLKLLAKHI